MKKMLQMIAGILSLLMLYGCTQAGGGSPSTPSSTPPDNSVVPPAGSESVSIASAPAPGSSSGSPGEWQPWMSTFEKDDIVLERTVDCLFSETGFVLDSDIPWRMPIDDYVAAVPNGHLLDPDNAAFVEERRRFYEGKGDIPDETAVRPAVKVYFTDLDCVLKPSVNFDDAAKLLYGGYSVSYDNVDEHEKLLKAFLLAVFDRYPNAFVRNLEGEMAACGREIVDTLEEINFLDDHYLTIAWQSKTDGTFMEVSTSCRPSATIPSSLSIRISLGLAEGVLANRWWMDIDNTNDT